MLINTEETNNMETKHLEHIVDRLNKLLKVENYYLEVEEGNGFKLCKLKKIIIVNDFGYEEEKEWSDLILSGNTRKELWIQIKALMDGVRLGIHHETYRKK